MCKKSCGEKEMKPGECSKEQIKECHGENGNHTCKDGKCQKEKKAE